MLHPSYLDEANLDIQVEYDYPIPVLCDNTSGINISKKLVNCNTLQGKAYPYQISFFERTSHQEKCQVGLCFHQGANYRNFHKDSTHGYL